MCEVLVLSSDAAQSSTWAAALKARGLRAKSARVWSEARRLLLARAVCVVLYADDEGIVSEAELLSASKAAGLPVIILAQNFDATRWISLIRSGAFEVLRYSTEPQHVCEAVEAAISYSRSSISRRSSRKALFSWARAKIDRPVSKDTVAKCDDGSQDIR
jgi:DNA-binding NtrC family response regulator